MDLEVPGGLRHRQQFIHECHRSTEAYWCANMLDFSGHGAQTTGMETTIPDPRARRRAYFAADLDRVRAVRRIHGKSGDGNYYGFLLQQIDIHWIGDPDGSAHLRELLEEYVRTGTIMAVAA